jgi:hypothetical protein
MDFKDRIKLLSDRVESLKSSIQTEEATKNAFIMPFIQSLGYDVFNPLEVVPEFVADIGLKKGEKIDYAIFKDNSPTILIECKHWNKNLDLHDGQLLRYFHVSKAKFGILTNGIEYRFYSDLEEPNKMDEKPFFVFLMNDYKENQVEELKKFHKEIFNIASIMSSASELKYTSELKSLIQLELSNPTPDFVRHFAKKVHNGAVSAKVLDQFTVLLKRSAQQFITDIITNKFQTVLNKEEEESKLKEAEYQNEKTSKENKIVTTEEELEAFMIIKSIIRQVVDSKRITYKDTQSYFVICIDDSTRKTICRLKLGTNKSLILFDGNKNEIKHELNTIDDIFNFSEQLILVTSELTKQ